MQYSKDPLHNLVYDQIKRSINVCIENECWDAAVKLIYSGIDTLAFLGMPENQIEVTNRDFITWVDRYLDLSGDIYLTGRDVYGARCSMLHTHSIVSRSSRKGECKLLGYATDMSPPIMYDPQVSKELVIVSIPALADAFFEGVDKYLIDLFSSEKAEVAERRLKKVVVYVENKGK